MYNRGQSLVEIGFRDLVESNNSDCDLCMCFCQYALCSCQTCCWWFFPDVGHKNFHSIDVGAAGSLCMKLNKLYSNCNRLDMALF